MNKDFPSLLASAVEIRRAAIRAIRLESDLHHVGLAQGYVLTSQALACLGRIVTGLDEKRPARAWTLTGPYGSGKSYFALFLLNLLGNTQADHAATMRALEQVDPVLAREVHEAQLDGSRSFFPIPITGYRARESWRQRDGCCRQGRQARHANGRRWLSWLPGQADAHRHRAQSDHPGQHPADQQQHSGAPRGQALAGNVVVPIHATSLTRRARIAHMRPRPGSTNKLLGDCQNAPIPRPLPPAKLGEGKQICRQSPFPPCDTVAN